jgi:hypothetical protein
MTPHEDPTSIGNVLLDAGIVTVWQLSEGVAYARQHSLRLGEALRHLGYINEGAIEATLLLQRSKRAETPREAAQHTHGLVAYAAGKVQSLSDRLDDAADRAASITRGLRSRRVTLKT